MMSGVWSRSPSVVQAESLTTAGCLLLALLTLGTRALAGESTTQGDIYIHYTRFYTYLVVIFFC